MKSLATNVLLYALNADCAEHVGARSTVERALKESEEWIVADQVYFELYRLLRNPSVLSRPLAAEQAAQTVAWFRSRSGWLRCSWEPNMMHRVSSLWSDAAFPARNTFDLVLAVTLAPNGVREFFTRNVNDFLPYNLFSVHNPIDDR